MEKYYYEVEYQAIEDPIYSFQKEYWIIWKKGIDTIRKARKEKTNCQKYYGISAVRIKKVFINSHKEIVE